MRIFPTMPPNAPEESSRTGAVINVIAPTGDEGADPSASPNNHNTAFFNPPPPSVRRSSERLSSGEWTRLVHSPVRTAGAHPILLQADCPHPESPDDEEPVHA